MFSTPEQARGFARWILSAGGGVVFGFFIAKGWITKEQAAALLSNETVVAIVAGGIASVGSLVWNMISKTKNGVAAAAQQVPEIQVVTTDPKIAEAVPGVINPTEGRG